ncbi:hypothetical protein [Oscillibacter sp.]|uniref:hypothetical protein n=1 Tax=Oscillibacter sp. TaxID=1945593 RepID=UPI00339B50DA
MTTINLRDYYIEDQTIEVSDEMAEALRSDKLYETAHQRRVKRNQEHYVIYAMEACGFPPEDIRRVVGELYYVFDMRGPEEAKEHFQNSPY